MCIYKVISYLLAVAVVAVVVVVVVSCISCIKFINSEDLSKANKQTNNRTIYKRLHESTLERISHPSNLYELQVR